MASATTRPALPGNTLCALGLIFAGPVAAHLLVRALTDPMRCGPWGLDCSFRVLLASLACWLVAAVLAARGLARDEPRWLAWPTLALAVLPLLAAAVAALAIAARQ